MLRFFFFCLTLSRTKANGKQRTGVYLRQCYAKNISYFLSAFQLYITLNDPKQKQLETGS